jgi:SpoIID/LytB domain protein
MKKLPKILIFILALCMSFSTFYTTNNISYADELGDLKKQIDQKQKEQADTLKKIKQIDTNIKGLGASTQNLNTLSNNLNGQKKDLEKEIATLNEQIASQELVLADFDAKLKVKEAIIEKEVNYIYKLSNSEPSSIFSSDNEIREYFSEKARLNTTLGLYKMEIIDFYEKIDSAKKAKEETVTNKSTAEVTMKALNTQLAEVAAKIAANQAAIRAAESQKSSLSLRTNSLAQQIDQLSTQQRSLLEKEQKILVNNPSNGGTLPLVSGQIYLYGRGRDLYQGHGVGMSQFGILGGAVKGMSATQMLQFYYSSSSVISLQDKIINVAGYGPMNINDYVAGLGEIPDNACEDLGIAFDANNLWKCWPREAIKSQVIAARSYAWSYASSGATICTTTACQVYKGGNAKKWASDATRNQYIAYQGTPISAVYSSDNSQGYGTANNDTVWSDFTGVGSVKPYLRAVNDSHFAMSTKWTNWEWRSNSYTIADLHSMLQANAGSCATVYATRKSRCIQDTLNSIGTLTSISFTKDPSRRVKTVILNGTKGSESIAGWLFKSSWNNWIGSRTACTQQGQCDFLFSLTFDREIKS